MHGAGDGCLDGALRECITAPSNFRNEMDLSSWLEKKNLTGICGIDTRALTRHIRKAGAQNAMIISGAIQLSMPTKLRRQYLREKLTNNDSRQFVGAWNGLI